jgi:hypothetical protein
MANRLIEAVEWALDVEVDPETHLAAADGTLTTSEELEELMHYIASKSGAVTTLRELGFLFICGMLAGAKVNQDRTDYLVTGINNAMDYMERAARGEPTDEQSAD